MLYLNGSFEYIEYLFKIYCTKMASFIFLVSFLHRLELESLNLIYKLLCCTLIRYNLYLLTQIADECVSFIFITEECQNLSSRLIQVLKRGGESIPAQLSKMSEKHMEAREKGKRSLLCHNFKRFGFCRYSVIQLPCEQFHLRVVPVLNYIIMYILT